MALLRQIPTSNIFAKDHRCFIGLLNYLLITRVGWFPIVQHRSLLKIFRDNIDPRASIRASNISSLVKSSSMCWSAYSFRALHCYKYVYILLYMYIYYHISIIRFLCNIQVLFCLIILFEKYCFLDSYNVQFYNPQLGIDTLLRSLIFGILQLAPVQYL